MAPAASFASPQERFMFVQSPTRWSRVMVLVVLAAYAVLVRAETPPLTLERAEQLAIAGAPGLAQSRYRVEAAALRVVADAQLPDPQLIVGAINVPTDTYKLNQEDMTMTMVGLRQTFPPGDTRTLRARRAGHELTREEARLELDRRNLIREVRRTWLELYYLDAALRQVDTLRPLLERQRQAAEGRYRAAQETQQVVLQARQALARLTAQQQELRGQRRRSAAMLARWIGADAEALLPQALPALPALPQHFEVEQHPDWLASRADYEAARTDIDIVRQERRPGMMLDLTYGFRRPMPDGSERPDMVTAMLTLDLPVFRAHRQDRRLAEKQAMESGARYEIEDKRRDLEAQYTGLLAEHESLVERVRLFSEQIVPNARREAGVTVSGNARDQTMLREAHIKALDAELELARLRMELARSQADLLYLTGEPQP
jgi:outer membrane protein TolC